MTVIQKTSVDRKNIEVIIKKKINSLPHLVGGHIIK